MIKFLFFEAVLLLALLEAVRAEDEDYWRREGQTPNATACGENPIPEAKMEIGSEIFIGVDRLCDFEGILLEPASEGGLSVGWLLANHWVAFDVGLSTAGVYDMELRVASVTGDGAFDCVNADTGEVYKVFQGVPYTGGWQHWETMSAGLIALPLGQTSLQVNSLASGWNLLWIKLTLVEAFFSPESYDVFVGANDFTVPEGVVLDWSADEFQNLAYIFTGDELDFEIEVPETGTYEAFARISNPANRGAFMVYNRDTGQILGEQRVLPTTPDWADWVNVELDHFGSHAGQHKLRVLILDGGFNLQFIGLNQLDSFDPGPGPTYYLVAAEDYEEMTGGMVDPINNNIGGLIGGDWVDYRIEIPTSGKYTFSFRVATATGSGIFKIEAEKEAKQSNAWFLLPGAATNTSRSVVGEVSQIPPTPGWHDWTHVEAMDIDLAAGETLLRLDIVEGDFNMLSFTYALA